MDANMPPGTYTMSANVHDNARNEDAVGYVTVDVVRVDEPAFANQGSMQLLIAENTNLQYPDDFIRVNSSGTSMQKVFLDQMKKYMGGTADIRVFSVQVRPSLLCSILPISAERGHTPNKGCPRTECPLLCSHFHLHRPYPTERLDLHSSGRAPGHDGHYHCRSGHRYVQVHYLRCRMPDYQHR